MNLTTLALLTQFGPVFPLAKNTKIPMKDWSWKKRNSDDLRVLEGWLKRFPESNWALVPMRAFVVDVDMKNGKNGVASVEANGGLDETYMIGTPLKGFHHYYQPDASIPFITSNNWIPDVDLRYGNKGYVVLPFSKTEDGIYQELSFDRDLKPIPEWIRERLKASNEPDLSQSSDNTLNTRHVHYKQWDRWDDVSNQVVFRFFRNKDNARIWNHVPVVAMKDQSQSGYEFQLAIRLMNVGATDEEIAIAYRVWCGKHRLPRKDRFYNHVMPEARVLTAGYIQEWQASRPARRQWGTSRRQIIEAIRGGNTSPVEIASATAMNRSTVRGHLSRMVADGALVKSASGYAIAGDYSPVAQLDDVA